MATQTKIELICDLSGDPADETVEFGLAGKVYEVDLTKQHADALKEILEDYVRVARPASKSSAVVRTQRSTTATGDVGERRERLAKIRSWASENGIAIAERGRISQKVMEAYRAGKPELAMVG